jgi:hypothetical protein
VSFLYPLPTSFAHPFIVQIGNDRSVRELLQSLSHNIEVMRRIKNIMLQEAHGVKGFFGSFYSLLLLEGYRSV